MGLETCSSGSVSVCVLLGSDRAALTAEKRCLKKKQFKTHPWNDEKCKHLPKEMLRNRENCNTIYMFFGTFTRISYNTYK